MIGHLRGNVIDRGAGTVVVECGGVGYEVHASSGTLASVGEIGSAVALRIYTHYSESKISLFGFSSAEERALFDLLITVKNVGPSSAIKILSAGAGPFEIAQMICSAELAALKSIKGVGKKTAELLVVELRDRCEALLMTWGANGISAAASPVPRAEVSAERSPVLDEVATALTQLGWKPSEVDKAVATLPSESSMPLEVLLREALRSMPR